MASYNKVLLMGNLTRDPELRYTPSGTAVCEFGLAVNRQYRTSSGEQRDETCFVDVTMWARRGVVISEYFHKGDPIFIEGRLQFDSWETADGRRSKLRVVAENFEFLGGGRGRGGGRGSPRDDDDDRGGPDDRGGRDQDQPSGGQRQSDAPPQEPPDEGFDVAEDEIPF